MHCPNCGTKADENAKFCVECGTKLTAATNAKPAPEIPSPLPKFLERLSPRLQKARWLTENDYDREALTLAQEEMKETPSLDALDIIFDAYLSLHEHDKAAETFQEMKKLAPGNALVEENQGILYLVEEKAQLAETCLLQVLERKNELPSKTEEAALYMFLTTAQAILGHPNGELLEKALALKEYIFPSALGTLYYMRACLARINENFEKAYRDLARAEKEGYKKDDDFFLFRAQSGYLTDRTEQLLDDVEEALKSNDAQTRAMAYFWRARYYFDIDEDDKAYRDLMQYEKEGGEKDTSFYFLRAVSGFQSGNTEFLPNDMTRVLNDPEADKEFKEILQKIQNQLDGENQQVIIDDDVITQAHSTFYKDFLDQLESYSKEENLHAAVSMFDSDHLKRFIKRSIKNTLDYWESVISPAMTPEAKQGFTAMKHALKTQAPTEFYKLAEKADSLMAEVIEHVPAGTWSEYIKNFATGAIATALGGWAGGIAAVLGLSEEDKKAENVLNRWNALVQHIGEEYDEIYSEILKRLDKFIEEYKLPVQVVTSDDTDESEDDDE